MHFFVDSGFLADIFYTHVKILLALIVAKKTIPVVPCYQVINQRMHGNDNTGIRFLCQDIDIAVNKIVFR